MCAQFPLFDAERKHIQSCCAQQLGRSSEDEALNFRLGTEDCRIFKKTLERDTSNKIIELSGS